MLVGKGCQTCYTQLNGSVFFTFYSIIIIFYLEIIIFFINLNLLEGIFTFSENL